MVLPIITTVIGCIFGYAGVAILFFNRYDVIADYTPADGKEYARRVGVVELIAGLLGIGGGILGFFLQNDTASWMILFICVCFALAGLSVIKKR